MGNDRTTLGHWVGLHEETCRGDRRYTVAVNRRDGHAIQLLPHEVGLLALLDGTRSRDELEAEYGADLLAELEGAGYLVVRPPAARRQSRITRLLRTLDIGWNRADPVVRSLYRHGLSVVFHPAAVVMQVIIGVLGAVATASAVRAGVHVDLAVKASDVPAIIGLNVVAIAVHELGHALVLVRHGATVHRAGVRLHFGMPACYIESADGLMLSRRQRLVQAMAGPWAEWLFTSLAAMAMTGASGALAVLLARFVIVNTFTVATNLLPFVGLDGSWILGDLIREPDLALRSRRAPGNLARGLQARSAPTLETVALVAYRIADITVAALFLVLSGFMWTQLFGDLAARVIALGPVGVVGGSAVLIVLVRPAVAAALPTALGWFGLVDDSVQSIAFRLSCRWRAATMRNVLGRPELAALTEHGINIVAGQLRRTRLSRALASCSNADLLVLRSGDVASAMSCRSGRRVIVVPAAAIELAGRACLPVGPGSHAGAVGRIH